MLLIVFNSQHIDYWTVMCLLVICEHVTCEKSNCIHCISISNSTLLLHLLMSKTFPAFRFSSSTSLVKFFDSKHKKSASILYFSTSPSFPYRTHFFSFLLQVWSWTILLYRISMFLFLTELVFLFFNRFLVLDFL